jgi:hypothetical protein
MDGSNSEVQEAEISPFVNVSDRGVVTWNNPAFGNVETVSQRFALFGAKTERRVQHNPFLLHVLTFLTRDSNPTMEQIKEAKQVGVEVAKLISKLEKGETVSFNAPAREVGSSNDAPNTPYEWAVSILSRRIQNDPEAQKRGNFSELPSFKIKGTDGNDKILYSITDKIENPAENGHGPTVVRGWSVGWK